MMPHALPDQRTVAFDGLFAGEAPAKPVDGADDVVGFTARDGQGRTWLAGRGLWCAGADGRAVPVRGLPFLADTDVHGLKIENDRLEIDLGIRGAASIPLAELRLRAGDARDDDIDQWAARQPHEPRYEDGAVLVQWRDPEPIMGPAAKARMELTRRLLDAVQKSDVPWYHADERDRYPGRLFLMYTPDPSHLADVIADALESEPLARKILIRTRVGPASEGWSIRR
jgi:hypothetical protein